MKPVLVLQHVHADGPAYLADWLAAQRVAFEVRNSEAGDAFPRSIGRYRALAILGGPMGANDELPSLRRAEALIRDAVARDVPVLGHCLGGQLMARALGGRVERAAVPEIGWLPLRVHPSAQARQWFGAPDEAVVFQWHYDTFDPPPGAVPLAGSAACAQQAFALGAHLALQFHVEIDAAKLAAWARSGDADYAAARERHPASVQAVPAMLAEAAHRLPAQQALAGRLYRRWLGSV